MNLGKMLITMLMVVVSAACSTLEKQSHDSENVSIIRQSFNPILETEEFKRTCNHANTDLNRFLLKQKFFYENLAAYLTKDEVKFLQSLLGTKTGTRIGLNISYIYMLGAKSQPMNRADINSEEKLEWIMFTKDNCKEHDEFIEKMRGFNQYLRIKYSKSHF